MSALSPAKVLDCNYLRGLPDSGSALNVVIRPSCGGRLANSLSARSSSANLSSHAASGKQVSLCRRDVFKGLAALQGYTAHSLSGL